MEEIITALGGAQRKLIGVVLSELHPRPPIISETDNMLERRANPVGRAATAGVPRISLGGLRLAVLDIEQTANFMIDLVFPERRVSRPLYLTSANGRSAGALLNRTDDWTAVPRRRPHQRRRTAACYRIAAEIIDAIAGARCDHRPVSRRRPQGRGQRG